MQDFIHQIDAALVKEREEPHVQSDTTPQQPEETVELDEPMDQSEPTEALATVTAGPSGEVDEVMCRLKKILSGEETIKHHMQFLIKNNHTDMMILKQLKDSVRSAW
jgi:hypothetical protein